MKLGFTFLKMPNKRLNTIYNSHLIKTYTHQSQYIDNERSEPD